MHPNTTKWGWGGGWGGAVRWTPTLVFLEVGNGKTKPNIWVERSPKMRSLHRFHYLKKIRNYEKTTKTYWLGSSRPSVMIQRGLSGINILTFYFQNPNWSFQFQHVSTTMSSVGIMNIFLTIIVVFESKVYKKLILTFLITHFQ